MEKIKRLIFDIETHPFSDAFRVATTEADRLINAPKMRIACVYVPSRRKYFYYDVADVAKLIAMLYEADEIISFNGNRFDFLVLERHYGLRKELMGKSVDIHEIMSSRAGFLVSLNMAVRLNFDERKHTHGREMTNLNIDDLKIACKSDVDQTYRLWKSYKYRRLLYPEQLFMHRCAGSYPTLNKLIDMEGGPGNNMPLQCPICHDVGSIVLEEWDTENMTEGQLADYIAGICGSSACMTCGHVFDWGF